MRSAGASHDDARWHTARAARPGEAGGDDAEGRRAEAAAADAAAPVHADEHLEADGAARRRERASPVHRPGRRGRQPGAATPRDARRRRAGGGRPRRRSSQEACRSASTSPSAVSPPRPRRKRPSPCRPWPLRHRLLRSPPWPLPLLLRRRSPLPRPERDRGHARHACRGLEDDDRQAPDAAPPVAAETDGQSRRAPSLSRASGGDSLDIADPPGRRVRPTEVTIRASVSPLRRPVVSTTRMSWVCRPAFPAVSSIRWTARGVLFREPEQHPCRNARTSGFESSASPQSLPRSSGRASGRRPRPPR